MTAWSGSWFGEDKERQADMVWGKKNPDIPLWIALNGSVVYYREAAWAWKSGYRYTGVIREVPVVKWTPKRIWFRLSDTKRGGKYTLYYAERRIFERAGIARISGGGSYGDICWNRDFSRGREI